MSKDNKPLGKGLSALISQSTITMLDTGKEAKEGNVILIPIENIIANITQPRKIISPKELHELASSISQYGMLQPILVKWVQHNEYQIIAGERRWRAAKIANLVKVPAIIKNIEDRVALAVSIIENVQRQNLNPLEESSIYQRLIEDFSYTQEELSTKLGKSRSYISNMLRLLKLPAEIQKMLLEEKLSAGHARALINSPKAVEVAERVINEKLNVRETEELVKSIYTSYQTHTQQVKEDYACSNLSEREVIDSGISSQAVSNIEYQSLTHLEMKISQNLNMLVKIKKSEDGIIVNIRPNNMQELDMLIALLCQELH